MYCDAQNRVSMESGEIRPSGVDLSYAVEVNIDELARDYASVWVQLGLGMCNLLRVGDDA